MASAFGTFIATITLAAIFLGVFCSGPIALIWWLAPACYSCYVCHFAEALAAYVVIMLLVRVLERRRTDAHAVAASDANSGGLAPLKGWVAHKAEAEAVHNQFINFLKNRTDPNQHVSISRSKGGHGDSNRTSDAEYKRRGLTVDVSMLDRVIAVDVAAHRMHIQPGVPMDELARIALAHGVVPPVILEFPGITGGGAVCGGGIESSSHKAGCFFDTVEELDIITGDGQHRIGVSRTTDPDLFHALSVSFGSYGILTRLSLRVEPAPQHIHVRYLHFESLDAATAAMEALANAPNAPEFIDGVALGPNSSMVVVGDGVAPGAAAPAGVERVSLRSARTDPWFFWHLTSLSNRMPALSHAKPKADIRALAGHSELMTMDDYLFRFDRGAFWMARHGLQVFYGSGAYSNSAEAGPWIWLRIKYAWLCTTRQLYRMLHRIGDEMLARTYIVQDYIMPGAKEACALAEYTDGNNIGIWPLWICPVRQVQERHPTDAGFGFPVTRQGKGGLMFNVGVYGIPNNGKPFDPILTNRALENEASRHGGRKMMYAQSFYTLDTFWQLFNKKAYEAARARFHANGVFPDVPTKSLLGEKRLARMSGVKAVSFADAAWSMAQWYFSLWSELLLPRALHASFGVLNTGEQPYISVAAPAASAIQAAEPTPSKVKTPTKVKTPSKVKTPRQAKASPAVEAAVPTPTKAKTPSKVKTPRKK